MYGLRLLALDVGKPMLIADEDCDTEYPEPIEEEETFADILHPQKSTILLASTHVARLLAPLSRACRSLCIPAETIQRFETNLANCMQLFPAPLQLQATDPLDPVHLTPIIQFQNTRLLLYRHNISPASTPEQRATAIRNCCSTARDTASLLTRCFTGPASLEQVEDRIRYSATSALCTHLWRCMLFLALERQWDAFKVLLRCSMAVDHCRAINTSCGRHLEFFLHSLAQFHVEHEQSSAEEDENIIVLLSGDLQSSVNGWVWGTEETGTLLSRRQKHSRSSHTSQETEKTKNQDSPPSWTTTLPVEEADKWNGWRRVHETAHWLETTQKQRSITYQAVSGNRSSPTRSNMSIEQTAQDTRSKMTIANII